MPLIFFSFQNNKSMKTILSAAILFLISANAAFCQGSNNETDFTLARSGFFLKGVYVFIGSTPVMPFDYIGSVKVRSGLKGNPEKALQKVINKGQKKNPDFNGMLFHKDDLTKVDLIRFKSIEQTKAGFRVGEKVTFVESEIVDSKIYTGTILSLGDKQAFVEYVKNSQTLTKKIDYNKLSHATGQ